MSTYRFVQVDEFQANADGWNQMGPVNWTQSDASTILLTNQDNRVVQLSFLSATALRVRFNPAARQASDYGNNNSYAVVNRNLGPVNLSVQTLPDNGGTLLLDTGILQVKVGLYPYGIAVYKNGQLIHEDTYEKNLIYSNEAVANLKKAPTNEKYYGFGEKAGDQLNKRSFNMTFFNYDNFTYNDIASDGSRMIPDSQKEGGPLNPSGPLYNTMPLALAVGYTDPNNLAGSLYSYGLFLDNVAQTYFNMEASDYSDMSGKYYFGALYGELDYYIMVGDAENPINDVMRQYAILTGGSAMPPKYAFGYQQGGYGYYTREILEGVAQDYRNNNFPIDGLHIDVDFQDNYRTFTSSNRKFPDAKGMFDGLHSAGFKCSTNITGIITANPLDENGNTDTPYPTRDDILNLNQDNAAVSTYKSDAPVHPFIYNTRDGQGEDSNIFIANEGYGNSDVVAKYSPSPGHPDGNDDLGTYGFYSDMGNPDVQKWWGEQYEYLLSIGLDMIWQDMTCPALIPNFDDNYPDKTLPLDIMMYDTRTGGYEPNAKIHNSFAINLIKATYEGITKLKSSDSFKGTYNYKKRNFIIARGGYAGVHRYAGIWTGDSASSWDFLKINVPEVLNIGLTGQPISGCDIGGFANGSGSSRTNGVTDPDLLTRWMTSGAFLPWYRNHYDKYTKAFQEPYNYGEPVLSNCRKYVEIRYRLLQVFYDAMYENTQNGLPIARALFVNDPIDPQVYQHCDDQFFLGKDILVAPVVTPNTYQRNVYLPAGSEWYVFNDNTEVLSAPTPGGTTQNWDVPMDLVPVYVREGAIIPLRELEQYVGELSVNPITFQIYPGKDSTYTLYQDDETTTAAEESGAYRVTEISHEGITNGQKVTVQRTYDKYAPKETYYFVALIGTNPPVSVSAKGKSLSGVASKNDLDNSASNAYFYDAGLKITFVKIQDTAAKAIIEAVY